MHLLAPSPAAVSLLAMAALPGLASPLGDDPLAAYRWKARVLLVLAPAADDPKLAEQRRIFGTMGAGAEERDLALVEGIGDEPRAIAMRRKFGLSAAGFHAVLIGKDGGDKLAADAPLGPDQLFPLIDAMPMRQQEKHGG